MFVYVYAFSAIDCCTLGALIEVVNKANGNTLLSVDPSHPHAFKFQRNSDSMALTCPLSFDLEKFPEGEFSLFFWCFGCMCASCDRMCNTIHAAQQMQF